MALCLAADFVLAGESTYFLGKLDAVAPDEGDGVRRLPVVDQAGVPQGILSTDDIITHGDMGKWQGCCELSSEEIIRALKRLYGQRASGHGRAHAAQA